MQCAHTFVSSRPSSARLLNIGYCLFAICRNDINPIKLNKKNQIRKTRRRRHHVMASNSSIIITSLQLWLVMQLPVRISFDLAHHSIAHSSIFTFIHWELCFNKEMNRSEPEMEFYLVRKSIPYIFLLLFLILGAADNMQQLRLSYTDVIPQ